MISKRKEKVQKKLVIVHNYLYEKITKEQAVKQLKELGFTKLEAVFELNYWNIEK